MNQFNDDRVADRKFHLKSFSETLLVYLQKLVGLPLSQQLIRYPLQKLDAFGLGFACFGGGFDGAAGFGAVGAVVEAALPDEVAQIGEVLQQVGGLEVVQAEFLQTGGVD